ncbi:MAG: glycerol kinase GlpK [Bdellovibrionales bacterium]|nr:glycerol kinase GlpK [Bdellovibrionales bacterium]
MIMSQFILAIDQGTTGTTVSIIQKSGLPLTKYNMEFSQKYPKPGWVEHDANEIWKTVGVGIEKVLKENGISGNDIAAIGITNQRETVVVWDKDSGKPVFNAIVWQCRRTTDFCQTLKGQSTEAIITQKTGLVVDPYFSGSKFRWILENVSGARKKAEDHKIIGGTIDSFLVWKLTGGQSHKTDVSNASRTQLMNIRTGQWDDELLEIFSVPKNLLPEIVPSSGAFGVTKGLGFLPDGIPISGVAGDQQAALFGQACFEKGEAKCTYGTGSFILMNSGSEVALSNSGLLTTVAWQLQGEKQLTYALEGGAFICGAAVQWLRDEMQFIKKSSDVEELARQVSSSEGVEFVPALTGLGAPYWDPSARGIITGLTRGSHRAHIARATLEAMALQNVDIIQAMEKDLKAPLKNLKVDGGAAANNLLMQMQSDFLQANIFRPEMIETTVAGASYFAGLGVSFWSDIGEIKKVWKINQEFQPQISEAQQKERLEHWRRAVHQAMMNH